MACLEMYNNSPHSQSSSSSSSPPPTMSPRISFSNDFAESHNSQPKSTKPSIEVTPASIDFEFSAPNYDMLSADELFFKGGILPFKPNNNNAQMQRTLRDQLLNDDDDDSEFSLMPLNKDSSSSSSLNRWKGFLGLKKSHIVGSKKIEKSDEFSSANQIIASPAKSPKDVISNGGPSETDMEMGI